MKSITDDGVCYRDYIFHLLNKKHTKHSLDAEKDVQQITGVRAKKKLMEQKHKNFMDGGK